MAIARRTGTAPFLAIWFALIVAAWVALVAWSLSPGARMLHHDSLGDPGGLLTTGAVLTAGWLLMLLAMMVPTITPLVLMFRTITRTHERRDFLAGLLGLGYIAVWSLFGVVIHALDWGMHVAANGVGADNPIHAWIAAGVFTLAGVFELTPLKYACLDRCRAPRSFIVKHWSGTHDARNSFLIGVEHGLFCVGCCWALMVVMFAVGLANIGWMLVLGAAMALEKNVSWGRQLTVPVAAICFALAGATLVLPS